MFVCDPTQKQKVIKIAASENVQTKGSFVSVKGGTISVDATVNYGRTYEFFCSNGKTASDGADDGIDVANLRILMTSPYISTKLYAKSDFTVKFKISEKPKEGHAFISDNRLYYYAPNGGLKEEQSIVIEAYDDNCGSAYFTVNIR